MTSVLIIEDHPESSEALEKLFWTRGLKSECVRTLEEGIVLFNFHKDKSNPFGCVVVDLCLPDSDAAKTLNAAKEAFVGTPIRGISGVQEPEIIELAHASGIPLILKGTSGVGIVESVLHAIAEENPSGEVFNMIAANRRPQREILPFEPVRQWFFAHWPRWVKVCTAAGAILSVIGASATMGGNLYGGIKARGAIAQTLVERDRQVDSKFAQDEKILYEHTSQLGTLHDDNIKMNGKLDELTRRIEENKQDSKEQLNRIERAIGRQPLTPHP